MKRLIVIATILYLLAAFLTSATGQQPATICDQPADANGDRIISLYDVATLLRYSGVRCDALAPDSCFVTPEGAGWRLQSAEVWHPAYDGAEVHWQGAGWEAFTALSVVGGVAESVLAETLSPGGYTAGIVGLTGIPYVATCGFTA